VNRKLWVFCWAFDKSVCDALSSLLCIDSECTYPYFSNKRPQSQHRKICSQGVLQGNQFHIIDASSVTANCKQKLTGEIMKKFKWDLDKSLQKLGTNKKGYEPKFPLWEPAYDIFVLRFQPKKTAVFGCLTNALANPPICVRELFKGSNGSASLVDYTQKKFFGWGMQIFCDWHHKLSSFGVILAHVAWPRAQPLGQSVSLKFSLETRLESESFEPLIDFLAFLVQKLSLKINKLIN